MKELVSDLLWTEFEPMKLAGLPIGRRVTVARAASGKLVVFSPLKLTSQKLANLNGIGEVSAFVLANRLHDIGFSDYFEPFEKASFLSGVASLKDHSKWPLCEISPNTPELEGFECTLLRGMPLTQEHAFLHKASKTLILTDALFNLPTSDAFVSRLLMRIADMGGTPRPSRLFRSLIRSKTEFSSSIQKVAEWDFDRIVTGHGCTIEENSKHIFRQAFSNYI